MAKQATNRVSTVKLPNGQLTETGKGTLEELFRVYFPDSKLIDNSRDKKQGQQNLDRCDRTTNRADWTRAVQESFWKSVPGHKFPNLRRCSEIVHSCFGSSYLCESAFSYLKMTKSKQQGMSVLSMYVAFTTNIMCRVIFTNIFA
jgi:hypothetical protein